MFGKFVLMCLMMLPVIAVASQPKGVIKSYAIYGSGQSEVMFVTIDPASSACPYTGKFVLFTSERKSYVSAFMAAFHSGAAVQIFGTGSCDAAWQNYEGIQYIEISK